MIYISGYRTSFSRGKKKNKNGTYDNNFTKCYKKDNLKHCISFLAYKMRYTAKSAPRILPQPYVLYTRMNIQSFGPFWNILYIMAAWKYFNFLVTW